MTKHTKNNATHIVYLFITALIWGSAFVAQSAGNVMGPFTFVSLRNFLAVFALIPVILATRGNLKINRVNLIGGIACGICLFLASNVQQFGLLYTSPGKAGFITAGYMVLVPIFGIALGKRPTFRIIAAVLLGMAGLYLLCIPAGEGFSNINPGDLLCLGCAVLFTFHILVIDHFIEQADGIKMSWVQFLVCGILSLVLVLVFEAPNVESVRSGLLPLLYAGVLSSAVGYTLQIVGQRDVNPAIAALILSLESCFAVLFGWLLLGSSLSAREILGCLIMFAAIILTQLPERQKG